MKQLRSILFFTIVFILLISPINVLLAADISTEDYNPDNLSTNSPSIILMDAVSGKVMYSKNAFERRYPASTTKLMTAILTLENCKLSDKVTVSHDAIFNVPVGYSHANLREGEILTVEQLLNVLLIPSANDAAFVLAEHIAGSVDKFSEMMNNKAKELGCLDTHFVNPNGIHSNDHYSTAYDMSLIGRYAMQFEDIMRIAMVNQYTLPKTNKYSKEDRIFNSTNGLITKNDEYYYPDATGLKTGYTDKSGYCIVTTAKRDNMELLSVVFGSDTIKDRYEDCIDLFDYGFENYSYESLVKKNDVIDSVYVKGATNETKELNVLAKDDIEVLMKNSTGLNNIERKVELNSDLAAPIAENEVVGKISYVIDGETFSADLVAEHAVAPSNFETYLFRGLLIFLILFLLVVILKRINKPRGGRKNYAHSSVKHSKGKRAKSKKGGRYKFTQIEEYL